MHKTFGYVFQMLGRSSLLPESDRSEWFLTFGQDRADRFRQKFNEAGKGSHRLAPLPKQSLSFPASWCWICLRQHLFVKHHASAGISLSLTTRYGFPLHQCFFGNYRVYQWFVIGHRNLLAYSQERFVVMDRRCPSGSGLCW